MGSDDVKTLIEKRTSALADAFTSEDVQKLMSFFSKDVDFSDIGTLPQNTLSTFSFCVSSLSHGTANPLSVPNFY
jgi:hypothetical protein